jgi:hypothetical protein
MDMGDTARGHLGRIGLDQLWCAPWSGRRQRARRLRLEVSEPCLNLFSSLPAVLRGAAGAGLVDLHGPGASPSSLLMCIGTTELILLAATVLLIKFGLDRWGPGRTRGVATSSEAERLLGVARLRRSRRIVRPDMYGKRRHGAWK